MFKLWELDDSTVVVGFRLGNLNLQSKSYNYNTQITLIANNYTLLSSHRVNFIREACYSHNLFFNISAQNILLITLILIAENVSVHKQSFELSYIKHIYRAHNFTFSFFIATLLI